ncbi:hypothetical protein K492DRAFT_106217, partial [Lichtheimia hyalospora FSU 10163]
QIKGIEEDKINKPDRPLVSGLLNKYQAIIRYIIVSFLYLFLSYKKQVFLESFIWFIVTILYNIIELDKHWFFKSPITICVQEFRDIDGDLEIGRKT